MEASAEGIKHDTSWRCISVDCGHDVMLDRPQELADLLLAVA
jgi:hypothetical protein